MSGTASGTRRGHVPTRGSGGLLRHIAALLQPEVVLVHLAELPHVERRAAVHLRQPLGKGGGGDGVQHVGGRGGDREGPREV